MISTTISLDYQINKLGFWSAITTIILAVVSGFLPLDIPGGFGADHVDRVAWLTANRGTFILAWGNQIVLMLSSSSVLFCITWQVSCNNPIRGIIAAVVVAMSVMAFIIPKFIAVWTIPMLVDTVSAGGAGAQMADALLLTLNVSVPYSLYTSFDYLGFWLWAVFALLTAGPLYGPTLSAKISSVCLGAFGILYHGIFIALLLGNIDPEDIEFSFSTPAVLVIITIVAMLFNFKSAMGSRA
jgi:hypothetical protein